MTHGPTTSVAVAVVPAPIPVTVPLEPDPLKVPVLRFTVPVYTLVVLTPLTSSETVSVNVLPEQTNCHDPDGSLSVQLTFAVTFPVPP